jgi:hypothetical protein
MNKEELVKYINEYYIFTKLNIKQGKQNDSDLVDRIEELSQNEIRMLIIINGFEYGYDKKTSNNEEKILFIIKKFLKVVLFLFFN